MLEWCSKNRYSFRQLLSSSIGNGEVTGYFALCTFCKLAHMIQGAEVLLITGKSDFKEGLLHKKLSSQSTLLLR